MSSKSVEAPPRAYQEFTRQYPKLATAWEQISDAGAEGPLDARTTRLVKLAIAIGAMREGAVHASVRKAAGEGVSQAEIDQVVALAASTLGMPATVAVFTWTRERRG